MIAGLQRLGGIGCPIRESGERPIPLAAFRGHNGLPDVGVPKQTNAPGPGAVPQARGDEHDQGGAEELAPG